MKNLASLDFTTMDSCEMVMWSSDNLHKQQVELCRKD